MFSGKKIFLARACRSSPPSVSIVVGMPGFLGVWCAVRCSVGVWRAALSCAASLRSGLAALLRPFSRRPPCVPPGCGSCLSGALVSRVPLRFVLSLRCACYSFRGVKRTRRQPTRKMPSGVGFTAHSPVSRWETCKLARSIPSPACLAGNASCSCIGLAQASSILGNGIPGTIDNKGNSCCATKRIKDKEMVCQKLITR